ncbi:MAG: ribonuclease P protein component [Acidimicrobiales bacterium]
MIGPIRGRRAFEALRTRGIRARSGPLGGSLLAEPDDAGTRVAYAIPKRVGGAVERNRLRRRLRAIVAELADVPGAVPAGALVVTAGPEAARRTPEELRIDVERLLSLLEERRTAGEPR